MWSQVYDPLGNPTLSTLCAALPVLVLLGTLGVLRVKAHNAALLGLATSLLVAILVFGMPSRMAVGAAAFGAAYGLFPIGWIVLNVIISLPVDERAGALRGAAHEHHRGDARSSAAAAAGGVLLWRLLRGRRRLRDPGGRDGGHSHRPRLQPAGGLGPVADCEHRSGRLRRARPSSRVS